MEVRYSKIAVYKKIGKTRFKQRKIEAEIYIRGKGDVRNIEIQREREREREE